MTPGGVDASAAVATHDVALACAEEASPRAREVRALLGFRDGRNSALLPRTLMLAELRALLGAVAPDAAPGVVAPSSASARTIAPAICWETYASSPRSPTARLCTLAHVSTPSHPSSVGARRRSCLRNAGPFR